MFTGLVEATGQLRERTVGESSQRLRFSHSFAHLALGESIAVSGACLTVVAFDQHDFEVDASRETLARTTLGAAPLGQTFNLERALCMGARLGGHLVTGHVDGLGRVGAVSQVGEMSELTLEVGRELGRFTAEKGSLCVDGVSLTINRATLDRVFLLVIPHTRAVTTLGAVEVGQSVNLEVDLVARYVDRLLHPNGSLTPPT